MSDSIYTMPFAYFTATSSGTSGKRSSITIPVKKFPVWLRKVRVTASTAVETCIYNTSNVIVVPINNPTGGTEVAGVNCVPGDQNTSPVDVVLYQSFQGYHTDAGFGLLGTPGFLETSGSDGSLLSVPDKTIIPPFCGLAIQATATNTTLAMAAIGYEIRFSYELDENGTPVPRRTRR